jgi:hypothetical protein
MISSRGVFQVKIVNGLRMVSVDEIEKLGTTEPSLEDVIRRFKT